MSSPSLNPKIHSSLEASTDGITLLSDSSNSDSQDTSTNQIPSLLHYQDNQDPPQNHPQATNLQKPDSQNNPGDDSIIFQPTCIQSATGSENYSKSNREQEAQKYQTSYNDTLSYLEDVLGLTYLNNLSKNTFIKQREHLPPKIQSSSTCMKTIPSDAFKNSRQVNLIKLKDKQIVLKPVKEEKILQTKVNPFNKKVQIKQIPSSDHERKDKMEAKKMEKSKDQFKDYIKQDTSTNKLVSRIKQSEKNGEKSQSRAGKSPLRTMEPKRDKNNQQVGQDYGNYLHQQRQRYQQPYSSHPNSGQQYQEYPKYTRYPFNHHIFHGYLPYQPMPYYSKYQGYQDQAQEIYRQQAQYNGPGQYYIPGNKRKSENQNNDGARHMVNGWSYPNRGNVVMDSKDNPWVISDRTSIDDRYFTELMKKQYHTTLEREALAGYMLKRNQLHHFNPYLPSYPYYTEQYEHYSSQGSMIPNQYFQNSNSINSVSQPSNNSQISTKTTPLNPKTKKHQNYPRQFPLNIKEQRPSVQHKVSQVKVSSKVSSKTSPYNPPEKQKKQTITQQHMYQLRQQQQNQNYSLTPQSQKLPSRILPPDILKQQDFYQQPRINVQMGPKILQKEESKAHLKPEVFLLYQIPVIVINQQLKNISADIFLVPYSQLMIQQKQPSKWIEYLQDQTKIDIMKKLFDMNTKQINERGRNIPQGTLSRVSLSQRVNFSSMYLVKLTHFLDQESRKPHGQTVLKEAIYKTLESFISGTQSTSKQNTLLIHGGYFPGVLREKTPKLIANFVSSALANLSVEYRTSSKGLKLIINVPKPDEYLDYVKNFRLVLNEYRRIQSI